jgi:hypothetical protein
MPNPDHRNRLRRRSAAPRLTWLLLLGLGLFSPAALAEGMIVRALRFLGVTASPAQLKDAEEPSPGGQVMVSDLGTPTPKKLTNDGVFAWPIFSLDGKTVLALNGAGSLVTIARDGSAPPRSRKVPGLRKLVGIDREQPGPRYGQGDATAVRPEGRRPATDALSPRERRALLR